jgi:hypothetical protein
MGRWQSWWWWGVSALLTSHFAILTIAGIIACLALIVANIRNRSSRR